MRMQIATLGVARPKVLGKCRVTSVLPILQLPHNVFEFTMATRRQYPVDWSPVPQKITTRLSQHEPRDERVRLPKSNERALRPRPLNIPTKQAEDIADVKIISQLRTASSESQQAPPDPQIVDVGPVSTWKRNASIKRSQNRKASPSITSTRQSEISLGILDYYMREPSPVIKSPELPPPTPKLDPAIDRFDFGLPSTPSPSTNVPTGSGVVSGRSRAATRTQSDPPLIPISPPSQPRPSATLNRGYTLFPVVKEVTPPPRQPQITLVDSLTLQDVTPASSVSSPPETTYRPRKESITSSVRTRNDSINSFQARLGKQRHPIPLRILSLSGSQTSSPPSCSRRTISTSTAQASPPSAGGEYRSRWSDETTTCTITSPSLAPTPGPRTSFGSLLRRDSAQYPACFFEDDDDESAPLRKKWAWKKSTSSNSTGRESRSSRKGVREIYEPEPKGGIWRLFLCGCGGR